MEKIFDLRLKEVDGQVCLCFGESMLDTKVIGINKLLATWLDKRKETEKAILEADTEEEKKEIVHEYYMWEWNFPNSTAGKPSS